LPALKLIGGWVNWIVHDQMTQKVSRKAWRK
jgi:hypothetical protein